MKSIWLAGLMCLGSACAQEAAPAAPAPPPGKIIVSDEKPPAEAVAPVSSSLGGLEPGPADSLPAVAVANDERGAVVIAAWDLDLHLRPAGGREEVQARLRLRNAGAAPVSRIPLQISSTLRWQAVSANGAALPFSQSPIATDEDHTGYAQEAVVTLPQPLAPGATLDLTTLYTGTLPQSSARLDILGVDPDRAANTEWDAIVPTSDTAATALRGFGNVLWYPVASPAAALGQGNRVPALISEQRRLGLAAAMRLHLTVEYVGEPPEAAIFNGHLEPLARVVDDQDQLAGEAQGVATADFREVTLGFRVPSLFLTTEKPETADGPLLSVISARPEAARPYAEAAEMVAPLLSDWLGPTPLTPLILLDHPGEPFADGPLLVAQLAPTARPEDIAPALVAGMTHAWFHAGGAAHVWLDEGLPQFMSLLWLERTTSGGKGRAAALQQLAQGSVLIGLAEPDFSKTPDAPGEPLISAGSDVMLRVKSASVLWQLHEILGEPVLRQALTTFRHNLQINPGAARDAHAFENTLEHASGKDLAWFFNDWVYRDRGLPDLTIVHVNPRPLPAKGGKSSGYLVAVEVRNDGDAVAEVPVVVRAPGLSAMERVRVPAHGTGSTRVLFESSPETVEVNDGSVPELRTSTHSTPVETLPTQP